MHGARRRSPLLLLDRVEQGRVALLLSDQIWLWSRGHQGGGPQAELLRRIAHWLMKEPALEEEALRARIEDDQLLIERRGRSTTSRPATSPSPRPTGGVTRLPLKPVRPGLCHRRDRRRRARRLASRATACTPSMPPP